MIHELAEAFGMLADVVNSDPFLELITAITWLDPLWHQSDDHEIDDMEEMEQALHILRHCMPELYVDTIGKLHEGMDRSSLENFVCGAVTQKGIPLDYIDQMRFGIPLTPVGVDFDDIDTYEHHPEFLPLLDAFGVKLEDIDAVDTRNIRTRARLISENLYHQSDPDWKKVGSLIDWVFSCSGNTLIDCTDEDLSEMQEPLWWDSENVALAIEMHDEADLCLDESKAALAWLQDHPEGLEIITANLPTVIEYIEANKGKAQFHGSKISLEWANRHAGHAGETVTAPELLQLRGDADQA